MDCSYGDTCGGPFTKGEVSVTNIAYPWEMFVRNDLINGYKKSMCLECTVNNALTKSPFQNSFVIDQLALDCNPSLKSKSLKNEIVVAYVSEGDGDKFIFTDFFWYQPITDCQLKCIYGDQCGTNFTGNASNVEITNKKNPWEITAS